MLKPYPYPLSNIHNHRVLLDPRASSNFHSALDNMHEALQDSTIQSSLQIGQTVRDFAYESLNFQPGPDVGPG
ncbi:hypothetical protein QBC36DRAFT_322528 [Triangularia setosa]|uniref:Uncharacterized protein n=1 Tax=Triangularia setosa TaxID=2587417 RepID=A0AAN7AAX1_9PEZI|nr:hypothetical protein QBC36DRAFT_322528 [Podospora setosa]